MATARLRLAEVLAVNSAQVATGVVMSLFALLFLAAALVVDSDRRVDAPDERHIRIVRDDDACNRRAVEAPSRPAGLASEPW